MRAFADLGQDARYVARGIRTAPGFHLTLVLTLALGLALTTVLLSVVDAVLVRPLPFRNADRLVMVRTALPDYMLPGMRLAASRVWRQQSAIFERIELYGETELELTKSGEPASLRGTDVSAGMFDMLGVAPQLGRTFAAEDFAANATPTVVVSDKFWREHLHNDPSPIGKVVTLNGVARTVIGVMPAGFTFHAVAPWAWIPLDESAARRGDGLIRMLAWRRAPLADAQAQADARAAQLAREEAATDLPWKVTLTPLGSWRANPDITRALWLVLAAAGCVLLIGCANAANLVLVRNVTREREIALRAALGAERWRIARQLLVESLVIAVIAGAAGVLAAEWLLGAVVPLIPSDVTFGSFYAITLDPRILAFAAVITLGTGIGFGMLPALFASSRGERLASSIVGRSVTDGITAAGLRSAALALQLAFAVVLVSGSVLFARSFAKLTRVDPGVDAAHLATMNISLGRTRYPDSTAQRAFFTQLRERLAVLPGVEGVSIGSGAPPHAGFSFDISAQAEGLAKPAVQPLLVPFAMVDTAYFHAAGTPLLAGRNFQPGDERERVAIVSTAMAHWLWGSQSPLGRRFRLGDDNPWMTVIGVSGDARLMGPDDREGQYSFYVYQARPSSYAAVLVRTAGNPAAALGDIRRAVREIDPDQPVYQLSTMEEAFGEAIAKPKFFLLLMVLFGASALALASVGIYGTASFAATRRTRELAIRMALGATNGSVKRLVVRQTVVIVTAGLAVGALAAAGLSRFVGSLLYGVEPLDPASLFGAAIMLFLAAVVASYLPVARVVRGDPLVSLRSE